MKLQLNFQIVRFLNYKQRFSDSLPQKQKQITKNKGIVLTSSTS